MTILLDIEKAICLPILCAVRGLCSNERVNQEATETGEKIFKPQPMRLTYLS